MEGLTRLVSESLARHGFDRPLDYRRLHWSRWFRCESHHSLLFVPSRPGVFALAEEIMNVGTAASCSTPDQSAAIKEQVDEPRSGADSSTPQKTVAFAAAETPGDNHRPESTRRLLAVTQFFEDEDMAFVLDRMLSRQNPMRARLLSGRYFVRYVVIDDPCQRRSICSALNQWMASAAEKVTGIGADFASSLELTDAQVRPTSLSAKAEIAKDLTQPGAASIIAAPSSVAAPHLNSGAATNIHCPSPFPSGF